MCLHNIPRCVELILRVESMHVVLRTKLFVFSEGRAHCYSSPRNTPPANAAVCVSETKTRVGVNAPQVLYNVSNKRVDTVRRTGFAVVDECMHCCAVLHTCTQMTLGFLRSIYLTRDGFFADEEDEDENRNDHSLSGQTPGGWCCRILRQACWVGLLTSISGETARAKKNTAGRRKCPCCRGSKLTQHGGGQRCHRPTPLSMPEIVGPKMLRVCVCVKCLGCVRA